MTKSPDKSKGRLIKFAQISSRLQPRDIARGKDELISPDGTQDRQEMYSIARISIIHEQSSDQWGAGTLIVLQFRSGKSLVCLNIRERELTFFFLFSSSLETLCYLFIFIETLYLKSFAGTVSM